MPLRMCDSHLTYKVTYNCLTFREQVEVADCHPSSPAVLWIVSVHKRLSVSLSVKKSWTFLACSLGCLVCNTRLIDNVSSNPIVPIQLFGINNVKLKINNQIWFLLKNHTQKVVEKLFAYPFLKNKNWAYLWI